MTMRKSVFQLTSMSMLTALSIIATRLLGVQSGQFLRLSFGGIPIILAGVLFGPLPGAMVGTAADLIGFMLNPMGGAYFPGFTLTSALTGVIPPLVLKLTPKRTPAIMFAAIFLTQLITNIGLNSYWLYIMLGPAMWVRLPARVISQMVMIPLYTIAVQLALTAVKHTRLAHDFSHSYK